MTRTIIAFLMFAIPATAQASSCKPVRPDVWSSYLTYSYEVRRLSNCTYREYRRLIDPWQQRGHGMDLDHKTAVKECWIKRISPGECAGYWNLHMLDSSENRRIGCKVDGCRSAK